MLINRITDSSGGAIVHAGVMEDISDSVFEFNGAGSEGPAILSLGLLNSMSGASFRGNSFFCEPGKFSASTNSVRGVAAAAAAAGGVVVSG